MLKTVVQTSHVSTMNVNIKTALSSREIEGCFLLYFDKSEEARVLRNSSSDSWPEINKATVKFVAQWALFNFGIRAIQAASAVSTVHTAVSADTLLSRQEILRWVSKFVN